MKSNLFSLKVKIWIFLFLILAIFGGFVYALIRLLPLIMAVLGVLLIVFLSFKIRDRFKEYLNEKAVKNRKSQVKKPSDLEPEVIDVEVE